MKSLLARVLAVAVAAFAITATAADAKKPDPSAPNEEAPAIAGITIPRGNGSFLGLDVVNNRFVLTFYDAEKQKTAPDMARAAVRWVRPGGSTPERAVMNPGPDAYSLTSPIFVRPPLVFRVYLSLFLGDSDEVAESHTVEYR